ncbi:LysR family transcriptional regulator [Cupriavidus pampae]|jgi:DNA-binding transcriptional LysR family regulator|uniref:HTH-type transcriptional regulator CynR n=1 Tax=Cupriavidus pampae TaxID=659251 RepID=A0ABM8WWG5_9BURK|nr:LysR family transcriptional regulator [Cupriavidus pampae]CAG9171859.1 HTH-type transcriptional regulator CynR [Cupriavidus pampae]
MNTLFLQNYLAVLEHGSIAEAARRLDLTPAAVAQQIRALERDMGTQLVIRSGRHVIATESGERVAVRARDVLAHVSGMFAAALDEEQLAGELRLGAGPTALTGMVPDLLSALVKRYPGISVFVQPGYSVDMHPAVLNGTLDAAIVMASPVPLPKLLRWQLLREEPLGLLVPAQLAGSDPHELLRIAPFIRFDRHEWGGQLVDRYLRDNGIAPNERFELNSLSAIAVMVDRGLGVALVPEWIRPWPEGLRLVHLPLPMPSEPRRMGLIWSRTTTRTRLVEALRDEAVRQFRGTTS